MNIEPRIVFDILCFVVLMLVAFVIDFAIMA
jgi:hypothetical protein